MRRGWEGIGGRGEEGRKVERKKGEEAVVVGRRNLKGRGERRLRRGRSHFVQYYRRVATINLTACSHGQQALVTV